MSIQRKLMKLIGLIIGKVLYFGLLVILYPIVWLYISFMDWFTNSKRRHMEKLYAGMDFLHPYDPYEPKFFKPLPDSSAIYIRHLPRYQNLPEHCYRLPTQWGTYLLPLALVKSHWEYLDVLMGEYRNNKIGLPPQFYKNFPGVSDVLLRQNVFHTCKKVGLYLFTSAHVGSTDETSEDFRSDQYLRYESSVTGAITALYMHAGTPILMLRSDPNARYGRNLGGCIEIPYGIRVHVWAKDHFRVSALEYRRGDGLYDVSVEVKDGVCVESNDQLLQEDTINIIV